MSSDSITIENSLNDIYYLCKEDNVLDHFKGKLDDVVDSNSNRILSNYLKRHVLLIDENQKPRKVKDVLVEFFDKNIKEINFNKKEHLIDILVLNRYYKFIEESNHLKTKMKLVSKIYEKNILEEEEETEEKNVKDNDIIYNDDLHDSSYFLSNLAHLALSRKEEKTAFEYFRLASKKSPVALFNVGLCYQKGVGTNQDLDKALECYKEALNQGHLYSGLAAGLICQTKKDYKESIPFFKRSISVKGNEITCLKGIKTAYEKLNDPVGAYICMQNLKKQLRDTKVTNFVNEYYSKKPEFLEKVEEEKIEKEKIEKLSEEDLLVRRMIVSMVGELLKIVKGQNKGKSFALSTLSVAAALGMWLETLTKEQQELFMKNRGLEEVSFKDVQKGIADLLFSLKIGSEEEYDLGKLDTVQIVAFKEEFLEFIGKEVVEAIEKKFQVKKITSKDDAKLDKAINNFVEKETAGKITQVVGEEVNKEPHLLLLNLINLRFFWKDKFELKEGTFKCFDGETVSIMGMQSNLNCQVYESDEQTVIEIPYESPPGRRISQLIVVPQKKSVEEFELSKEKILYYLANLKKQKIELWVPNTRINNSFDLTKSIPEMTGVAFNNNEQVIQHVSMINNEKGSEISVVTVIGITKDYEKNKEIRVETPYILLFIDQHDADKDTITIMAEAVIQTREVLTKT